MQTTPYITDNNSLERVQLGGIKALGLPTTIWEGAAGNLVCLTKDSNLLRGLAAEYARPGSTGLLDGNAAEGRFRGVLDLLFAFAVPAPVGLREACLHGLPKLVKIPRRECVRSAEGQRAVKQRLLNLDQQFLY